MHIFKVLHFNQITDLKIILEKSVLPMHFTAMPIGYGFYEIRLEWKLQKCECFLAPDSAQILREISCQVHTLFTLYLIEDLSQS